MTTYPSKENNRIAQQRGRGMKPVWALAGVALLGAAGAVGALVVASSGGEEEVVQQIETATATSLAESPTAAATVSPSSKTPADGWEVYTDPQVGFSFPHPPDTTVEVHISDLPQTQSHPAVDTRTLTFSNGEGVPAVSLFIVPNPDSLSLEHWITEYPGCCFGKPETVTVAGEPALRFPEDALDHNPTVLFRDGGFIFGLAGFVASVPESPAAPILSEADFQRILASFRYAQ